MARRRETLSEFACNATCHKGNATKLITHEQSALVQDHACTPIIMPTYYSRLTSVQLAVTHLQDTTTTGPETLIRSNVSDEISRCAAKFAEASINGTLDETPIRTGDLNTSDVRFLGKHGNMPFLMVRAGKAFFEPDTEGRRTRRPARVPASIEGVDGSKNLISTQLSAITHNEQSECPTKPVGHDDGGREVGQHLLHLMNCFVRFQV